MSHDPLEPLDPDLAALLDAERRVVAPAASLRRVWSRVEGGPLPGAGENGARSAGQGWLASHAVPLAAGTFVAGVVAGATGYAALRPAPAERIVYVDRAAPLASIVATIEPHELLPPAPSSPRPAPAERPSARSAAPIASESTLVAERTLLDDARAALGGGDAARTLSLLDEHARRFPKPQLAEEREALAIQALVVSKRYDEARSRAARFRTAAPNSLFLPVIEASLASIP